MAHKKAAGSTRNGRDSRAKRLGIKVGGGEAIKAGGIIVRQKGTNFFPGKNVGMGNDYTIFATVNGVVKFTEKRLTKYDGRAYKNMVVNVVNV